MLQGRILLTVDDTSFGVIGGRPNVFEGPPYSVYVPPGRAYTIKGVTPFAEVAVCSAPSTSEEAPFLITPDEVKTGVWGVQNFSRHFRQILVDTPRKVERLIVGETITPSGNWSTYPPHKHEVDDLPREVFAEVIYYFRVSPPEGFGLAYHYTDDRHVDAPHVVRDDTILFIPHAYHTVVSAPGYATYYLWVLAGHTRTQAAVPDPHVGWVGKAEKMLGKGYS